MSSKFVRKQPTSKGKSSRKAKAKEAAAKRWESVKRARDASADGDQAPAAGIAQFADNAIASAVKLFRPSDNTDVQTVAFFVVWGGVHVIFSFALPRQFAIRA